MPRNDFLGLDVSAYVARVAAVARSTNKRIANSAASSAEGSVMLQKTADTLRASYQGLAARSDPFTVDTFGPHFR